MRWLVMKLLQVEQTLMIIELQNKIDLSFVTTFLYDTYPLIASFLLVVLNKPFKKCEFLSSFSAQSVEFFLFARSSYHYLCCNHLITDLISMLVLEMC